MAREELEAQRKDELIEVILAQAEQIAQLQAAFRQLQADHEALKLRFEQNQKKPPTMSKNSSQPPSKDQKGNKPKDRRKRRHGPPLGHEKHERKFVAQANEVINLAPQNCYDCHVDLSGETGRLVQVNQITELPEAKAQVIEVRQYEVVCPGCQQAQVQARRVGCENVRRLGVGD
jgi:hypothetical protein